MAPVWNYRVQLSGVFVGLVGSPGKRKDAHRYSLIKGLSR